MSGLRVVIADDQDLVRTGLRMILENQPDIEIVAEAANGHEAVAAARQFNPDVCLFDVRMPELDGIEATRIIAGPDVADPMAVVIITTFDIDEHVHAALRAGARGFLRKDASADFLVQAVRAAAEGDALISPAVTARLLDAFGNVGAGEPPAEPVEPLTTREEEIVAAVSQGNTNAEIAELLHVSLSTVKSHINSIMTKLDVRNRVELAMWAHDTGRRPDGDR